MSWGIRNRMVKYAGDAKVGSFNLLAVLESQGAKVGISTHTWMPVQDLMKFMAEERKVF